MAVRWFALAAVVLVGCHSYGVAPAESAGDTQIWMENGLEASMCFFSLTKTPKGSSQNWLTGPIPSGKSASFSVKPGEYILRVAGCSNDFRGERRILITRDTEIVAGTPMLQPIAGWSQEEVEVTGHVNPVVIGVNCNPRGASVAAARLCCSGSALRRHGDLICE